MASRFKHFVTGKMTFFSVMAVFLIVVSGIIELIYLKSPFPLLSLLALILLVYLITINKKVSETQELIRYQIDNQTKQIESLIGIYSTLQFNKPLPFTGGWALSPDILKLIVDQVIKKKPNVVVELGSGVSTVVLARLFQQLGQGHLISIDHDQQFMTLTQKEVAAHQLEKFVTFQHCPITSIRLKGQEYNWYNTSFLKDLSSIDMLIIDGPYSIGSQSSRYPAIPLLYEYLNHNSTVIVDDCNRPLDKQNILQWKALFPGLNPQFIETEKGAYIMEIDKSS